MVKTKREREELHFNEFLKHYNMLPGRLDPNHKDKPDFIWKGPKHIGIELTNFYLERGNLPGSEQAQRPRREGVVSEAQKICLENKNDGREFTFSFEPKYPITDQRKLAKGIANFVERLDPFMDGEIPKHLYAEIPELASADVSRGPYNDTRWRVISVHTTPQLSMDSLRDIVQKKEQQAVGYKPCDAYWLLVVVHFWDRAQDQEIRLEGFERIESSVFERIVVFKTVFGHVLEVK